MTTEASHWWQASAIEWLKAAGIMAGGLATAIALVLTIVQIMSLL